MTLLDRVLLTRAAEQTANPKALLERRGRKPGPAKLCRYCSEPLGGVVVTFGGRRIHERCHPKHLPAEITDG